MVRWLFFFLVLVAPLAGAAERITLVDRIVAIVNKDVITASELDDAVGMAERELRRRGTPARTACGSTSCSSTGRCSASPSRTR